MAEYKLIYMEHSILFFHSRKARFHDKFMLNIFVSMFHFKLDLIPYVIDAERKYLGKAVSFSCLQLYKASKCDEAVFLIFIIRLMYRKRTSHLSLHEEIY